MNGTPRGESPARAVACLPSFGVRPTLCRCLKRRPIRRTTRRWRYVRPASPHRRAPRQPPPLPESVYRRPADGRPNRQQVRKPSNRDHPECGRTDRDGQLGHLKQEISTEKQHHDRSAQHALVTSDERNGGDEPRGDVSQHPPGCDCTDDVQTADQRDCQQGQRRGERIRPRKVE